MLFNTIIRVEPYLSLNGLHNFICKITGVAWLSAVRVVRCQVESANERNPYKKLLSVIINEVGSFYLHSIRSILGIRQAFMTLMEYGLQTCYLNLTN